MSFLLGRIGKPLVYTELISRSSELIKLAQKNLTHHQRVGRPSHDLFIGDILSLPVPSSQFNHAISIAVLHHLSTPARRVAGIQSMLSTLTPSGQLLLFVWALEQASSRRGWDDGDNQDVLVPWVMKGEEDRVYGRYYHLYRKGELEREIVAAGGRVLDSGYEKDNWWAIAQPLDKPK